MSDNKNINNPPERGQSETVDTNIAASFSEVSSVAGSVKTSKTSQRMSSSSERQIKFERAQKCLENAALVSKRIKEHRKATAELLGRPFEEDDGGDTASEMASTMSERTGYSAATDTSTTLSVQDALNIPGISESLANTLKQKELLMERIKQYKEISKRPIVKSTSMIRRESTTTDSKTDIKGSNNNDMVQLVNTIKEKENALSVIQVKMKAMETTILDLQEKLNEKDQIIEAKNKATALMSQSLSKKEMDSMALLEDTRHQMTKMQENFITMETEWRDEKQRLLNELVLKDEKISNLEEANTILENSRFEISVAHSKLTEELELKNKEILQLEENLKNLSQAKQVEKSIEKDDFEEEKGSLEIAGMVELTKKVELLEQLNCQIRQTNKELENKLATMNPESKSPTCGSPSKKASPIPTRKGGRNTASKMKSPWSHLSSETLHQDTDKKINKNEITRLELLVQSLNKDILEKEYEISEKNALISELKSVNTEQETKIPGSDMVDIGISTEAIYDTNLGIEISKPEQTIEAKDIDESELASIKELEEKLKAAQDQIDILNNDIESANKNMIKVKSNNKLKLKQLQKTIDNFSKVSDANAEIIKQNEELHQLSQKVAELEEEKGNLQLHLVDYDSGRLTESDVYKKMVQMENLAETRLKAISVLETQKFDLVQELHILQQKNLEMEDKLADMSQLQNEQVCSEIKSVQLEEQLDVLTASKKELELIIENIKLDKEHLNETIKSLQEEKDELVHKLENYIQENIELTDKLEKLSAEKVSSAESIEIVESLTTQEKLELEKYNKGIIEGKKDDSYVDNVQGEHQNIKSLIEQSAELNNKIEMFTQERQEVMEKMNKISTENELLHDKIVELNNQCSVLQSDIEMFNKEKLDLQAMNQDLTIQIEDLKRERIEIMKESIEVPKPISEDTVEGVASEISQDDKSGDKGINRNKTAKQLTKEILKLKNTIKDREAEIGDCQMKILSLEEQQQKQNDILQSNKYMENKLKTAMEENGHLKEELDSLKKYKESEEQLLQFKQSNDILQHEIQKIHQEYTITLNTRDTRINELENLLLEYEKQIYNYSNTLQQKDKDMTEYINQITKLNDVSQKLKSTIDLLEEEKVKDQNAELVKSLNKQIVAYQKKMSENEDKIRILLDEKSQLLSVKDALENKNVSLETDLKNLQEALVEKQALIKDLQAQQQKSSDELSAIIHQSKERDEEIHEIKLQLRKESIENEKLRTSLSEKDSNIEDLAKELDETKENLSKLDVEKHDFNEQYVALETKNRELLEKLKKFALTIKKKSSMYTELEAHMNEFQKQMEAKNEQIEQLLIQVETLPALQDKFKHAEEEINRLQIQKASFDQQKSQDILQMQTENNLLKDKFDMSIGEITKLSDSLNYAHVENNNLKAHIDVLNNKLVEHEIEQKNNINLTTKLSTLEADIIQKQNQIAELSNNLQYHEQQKTQVQFGYDAKIQERDMYIENLESEIAKYKNRICRLEETISVMENRRNSLERKADQLGNQLHEKQKAYTEYTSQEDELVGRLAVLMDHDRVVEKQLHEIECENKELQHKIQYFGEENQRVRKSLSDIQEHCNTLVDKASKADILESELSTCQTQLCDVESNFKRISHEHQMLLVQRKQEIEELEQEFNTQIENAFREKKVLSEKYEKIIEHVAQLEVKLQEYRNNIEALNINNDELNRINQELIEKSTNKQDIQAHDYTEQYISEINRLNSVVNDRCQEIVELQNKIQLMQTNNLTTISNFENRVLDLTTKLNDASADIERLVMEVNYNKESYEQLQLVLSQKEQQIKDLMETKKLSFEMAIPKTEGMIISSTIEALNDESREFDMSALESQIVTDISPHSVDTHIIKKIPELMQQQTSSTNIDECVESVIVPKKAYLCYKEESEIPPESDPFNSDEGWGLGDSEEIEYVTPEVSHLNDQIRQLKKDNQTLKADLETSNTKLQKALKKLKELKLNNDMLSNDLNIAKQISSSSFLDSAIEDELRINIKELEKKVEDLNADIKKEKREKDNIKKQNEVFNNANDRLTDIKEKLENEIELWKYKFKEANDKVSAMHWGADAKDSPRHEDNLTVANMSDNQMKEEIIKIEKENDELQLIIDQLTSQNKELFSQQSQLKNDIVNLNNKLQQYQSLIESSEIEKSQYAELQNQNTELLHNNEIINKKLCDLELRYNEAIQNYENFKSHSEIKQNGLETNNKTLIEKCSSLEEKIISLNHSEEEVKKEFASVVAELEQNKAKLHDYEIHNENVTKDNVLKQQYKDMEEQAKQLKCDLQEASSKIVELVNENQELTIKNDDYQKQLSELNAKIQNLNGENDNLLSTVAELRSSVSTAVDQRGFEIAELWKQHLAQRETDFQNTESELRAQLSASEAKYEQLLDSVQSSSQEETNKLVTMEQVNSLHNKLQDKEEHLRNLQDKYAEVMNQLDLLRSEIEDENITQGNKLLEQQEEYEKIIQELREESKQNSGSYENLYKTLQTELTESKIENDKLNQEIEDLNSKIKEFEVNILDMNTLLKLKETEIYQKSNDFTLALSQRNEEFENVRKLLIDYEKKIEDLTFEKESELAILRLKMHEDGNHFTKLQQELELDKLSLTEALSSKIEECTNLNRQIVDLNKALEEHSSKAIEMQSALENQEIEIVTLKDEVSNLLMTTTSKIEKHVSFASGTKLGRDADQSEGNISRELHDAVPRAELDLALYMLHQRDVRCEELTMELTQLLEERDTLQLRLSDSLRSNEELKSRCKAVGLDDSISSSQEAISELPSFSVEKEFVDTHRGQTSRSSSMSDLDGDKPKLQAKLSELRTVRHSRDVRLRHESEQRHLDYRLLQRDVANLPPEAVEHLTQAHHTLSRDAQSTPTVLLNWLRGKSTPKVVHM